MRRSRAQHRATNSRLSSTLTAAGALGAATAVGVGGAAAPAQAEAGPTDALSALRAPGQLPAELTAVRAPSTQLALVQNNYVTTPATPARSSATLYTVRAGDTVSHIALRYNTSVATIVSANDLNSAALIRIGQVLTIPGSSSSSSSSSSSDTPSGASTGSSSSGSSTRTHTVRAGDTVWDLARQYDVTVAAVISANNLGSNAMIRIGQSLSIPGSGSGSSSGNSDSSSSGSGSSGSSSSGSGSSSARSHTVRAGETVSGLALRYSVSASSIISANNLGSNAMIRIGQSLSIPGSGSGSSSGNSDSSSSGSSSSGSSSSGSSSGSSSSARSHTVRSGDTLSHLARQYGVSSERIISANNMSSTLIYVGQVLAIPGSTSSSNDEEQLVPNTFLHYTYPDDVVAAANDNKRALLSMNLPSRDQMQTMVRDVAASMGVDPALALAVAQQESGFDPTAVSPANAIGVMQVIPSSGLWAGDLVGRQLNLLDPRDNVTAGVAILRALERTSDDLPTAIASYYQGAGSVSRNGMYDDTRRYVANVQTLMTRFS